MAKLSLHGIVGAIDDAIQTLRYMPGIGQSERTAKLETLQTLRNSVTDECDSSPSDSYQMLLQDAEQN